MISCKTLGDLPSHWHTGGVPPPQLGALSALMLGSLPISLPVLCLFHSDAFAKLLESGDLSMSSIKVDGINMSFQNLLTKICFHHHFSGKGFDGTGRPESLLTHGSPSAPLRATLASPTCSVAVVERVDSCASLYSRSIQGHHVCLLVKKVSLHEGSLLTPCHHAPHTMSPPSSPCRLSNVTHG